MAKGFSNISTLLLNQTPISVAEAMHAAHDLLILKRKLTLSMASDTFEITALKHGDLCLSTV